MSFSDVFSIFGLCFFFNVSLYRLIDGENVTMSDEHMWLIPFTPGGSHLLTITLKEPMEITGLRLWNYNKSPEGTYRGVRRELELKFSVQIVIKTVIYVYTFLVPVPSTFLYLHYPYFSILITKVQYCVWFFSS